MPLWQVPPEQDVPFGTGLPVSLQPDGHRFVPVWQGFAGVQDAVPGIQVQLHVPHEHDAEHVCVPLPHPPLHACVCPGVHAPEDELHVPQPEPVHV